MWWHCCIVSHICIGIACLLSYVMSRGAGDRFKSSLYGYVLMFHFIYHQVSFLSLSFIWVSWEEVSDDFEQRMKALWKSLLFCVVAGQTKSNETYRECVCVHLAVLETRCLEFILESCLSSGASLTFSTCVTPNYSIKFLNWSLTRNALLHQCRFLTPSNNEVGSTCPDSDNIWDTSGQ
jgi:hypothetical protein